MEKLNKQMYIEFKDEVRKSFTGNEVADDAKVEEMWEMLCEEQLYLQELESYGDVVEPEQYMPVEYKRYKRIIKELRGEING